MLIEDGTSGEERRGKEQQHIFEEIVPVLTSLCTDGSGYGKEVTIVMVMDYGWEKEWGKGEINIFRGRDDFVQYCDHLRTTGPPSPSQLIGLLLAKELVLIDISSIITLMIITINGDDNNT